MNLSLKPLISGLAFIFLFLNTISSVAAGIEHNTDRDVRDQSVSGQSVSEQKVSDLSIKTESWMFDFYQHHSNTKLRDILIPKAHDAGSYSITDTPYYSELDGIRDELELLSKALCLNGLLCDGTVESLTGKIVQEMSVTQNLNIYEQLKAGARYIDLRAMTHQDNIHMHHGGVVGATLAEGLKDIARFAKQYPKEIVFVDFREPTLIKQAKHLIETTLSALIFDASHLKPKTLTFQDVWLSESNIIFLASKDFYPHIKGAVNKHHWRTGHYANSDDSETIKKKVANWLENPSDQAKHKMYMLSLCLTQQAPENPWDLGIYLSTLFSHGNFSIQSMDNDISPLRLSWLREWMADDTKRQSANIFGLDFIDTEHKVIRELLLLNSESI